MPRKSASKSRKTAKPVDVPLENTADTSSAEIRFRSLLDIFTKPSKSQHASVFLAMATELRLKVLRYLMKNEGPIFDFQTAWNEVVQTTKRDKDQEWHVYKKRTQIAAQQKYRFSSQIFRCCQQLYQEGRYILYKENQVTIQYFNWYEFSAPEFHARIDYHSSIYPYEDLDLLADSLQHIPHNDYLDLPQRIYPALAEFDKIFVNLNILTRLTIYKAARTLKYLLCGKEVTISITKGRSLAGGVPVNVDWLSSCRIWKCKEITFTSHQNTKVDKIANLITSSANDTHDEAYELGKLRVIYRNLRARKFSITKDVTNSLNRLEEAIMSYNSKLVKKHKAAFLKAAKDAVENATKAQTESFERAKAQMKKEHDDLLDSISNCD